MTTIVLIHGALHGGWCWEHLKPRLEGAGCRVLAPDLPGMGADRTPLDTITLRTWGDFVADLVSGLPEAPLLVGHSLGGLVIGEAAERVPDNLLGLVYLAALLLPTGVSSNEFRRGGNLPVQGDAIMAPDGHSFRYPPEKAIESFFNTTDRVEARKAAAHLTSQPVAPLGAPASVTAARFGPISRAYIECLRDVILPIEAQRAMQRNWPCSPVISMNTDHSPFLSAPELLADHLIAIDQGFRGAATAQPRR